MSELLKYNYNMTIYQYTHYCDINSPEYQHHSL